MSDHSYAKVADYRGKKRIWLQNETLAKHGFKKGVKYRRDFNFDTGEIQLVIDEHSGDLIVSGRMKPNGGHTPIIDLTNADVVDITDGADRVRIDYRQGIITVAVHHLCRKQQERVTRLKAHLEQGQITEGTLCVGVGMATLAMKQGFEVQGIEMITEWVVDRERKYLDAAIQNNPAITGQTQIFEASLEEIEPQLLGPVDVMQVSLPCTGHSRAGKAKNGLSMAEDHVRDATAVYGLLKLLEAVNPAVIISENVMDAKESATYILIKGVLSALNYTTHEVELNEHQAGSFETRKRYWFIAVDASLPQIDLSKIPSYQNEYSAFSALMEHVPDDSPLWRTNEHLKAKAIRDKAQGKNFSNRPQITGDSTKINLVRRLYNKMGSADPVVLRDDGMERPLTPIEHCRVKGAPDSLVSGLNATTAHEVLGQGITMGQGRGCAEVTAECVFKPLMKDYLKPIQERRERNVLMSVTLKSPLGSVDAFAYNNEEAMRLAKKGLSIYTARTGGNASFAGIVAVAELRSGMARVRQRELTGTEQAQQQLSLNIVSLFSVKNDQERSAGKMSNPLMLIRAEFETPNFTFEAFGESKEQALSLLKQAWEVHAQQAGVKPGYLKEFASDIEYTVLKPGIVIRDKEVLLDTNKPKPSSAPGMG